MDRVLDLSEVVRVIDLPVMRVRGNDADEVYFRIELMRDSRDGRVHVNLWSRESAELEVVVHDSDGCESKFLATKTMLMEDQSTDWHTISESSPHLALKAVLKLITEKYEQDP